MSTPRPARTDRRVDLVLLGVALVWGSSYLSAKLLVGLGVAPLLALRYAGAALALGLVAAAAGVRPGRAELRCGLVLGLTQAAVLGLETQGLAGTSATSAGLLIASTLLFTPLAESLVRRRWLPPAFFAAVLVALVGIGLLVGRGGLHAPLPGDLLVLAAAVVRAGHVTALGVLAQRHPLDLRALTLVQLLVGAVLFAALDPRGLAAAAGAATPGQWLGIAHLALGCTVFAFLAQSWAIRRTSASRAGLLLGTEPLWAVAIGVALGGEVLGPVAACGALLLLAGTSWGRRAEARDRLSAAAPAPSRPPGPAAAAGAARRASARA